MARGTGIDPETHPVDDHDLRRWADTASAAGEHDVALALATQARPDAPGPLDHLRLARFQVLAGRFSAAREIVEEHGDTAVEEARPGERDTVRATVHAARALDDGHAWAALRRMADSGTTVSHRRRAERTLLLAVAQERGDDEMADQAAQDLWHDCLTAPRGGGLVPRDVLRRGAVAWMTKRPRPSWFASTRHDDAVSRHVDAVAVAFAARTPFPERHDADLVAVIDALDPADARLLLEHARTGLGTPRTERSLEAFRRPLEAWRRPIPANAIGISAFVLTGLLAPPLLLVLLPLMLLAFLTLVRVPPLSLGDSRAVFDLQTYGVHPEDGRVARDVRLPRSVGVAWFVVSSVIAGVGVAIRRSPQEQEPIVGYATPEILGYVLVSGAAVLAVLAATARARRRIRADLLAPLHAAREEQLAHPTLGAVAGVVERGPLAAALAETGRPLPGPAPSVADCATRPILLANGARVERVLLVDGEEPVLLTQRVGPGRPLSRASAG